MQKYNSSQPNENHVRNTRLGQKYSCVIGMGAGARCSKIVQSQIHVLVLQGARLPQAKIKNGFFLGKFVTFEKIFKQIIG